MYEDNRILDKIEQLVDKLPYRTVKIEIDMGDKTYSLSKDRQRPIGFFLQKISEYFVDLGNCFYFGNSCFFHTYFCRGGRKNTDRGDATPYKSVAEKGKPYETRIFAESQGGRRNSPQRGHRCHYG